MENEGNDTKEEGELSDDDEIVSTERLTNYENQYDYFDQLRNAPTQNFPIREKYRQSPYDNWYEGQPRNDPHNRHMGNQFYSYSSRIAHPPPRPLSLTYDRIRVSPQRHPVHMSERDRKDFRHFREKLKKISAKSSNENLNYERQVPLKSNLSPGFWEKRKLRACSVKPDDIINNKQYKDKVEMCKKEMLDVEQRIKALEAKEKAVKLKKTVVPITVAEDNDIEIIEPPSPEVIELDDVSPNISNEAPVDGNETSIYDPGKVTIVLENVSPDVSREGEMELDHKSPDASVESLQEEVSKDNFEDGHSETTGNGVTEDSLGEGDIKINGGTQNEDGNEKKTEAQQDVNGTEIQTLNTEETDEEELDELELRRIALASAYSLADKGVEDSTVAKNEKRKSLSKASRMETRMETSQRSTRSIRPQRVLGRRSDADRYRRRSKEIDDKRREIEKSLDRRRNDERKTIQRRNEEKKENQRREIQKILTLDDPKEQVKRFLLMLGDKKALDSIDLAGYQKPQIKRKKGVFDNGQKLVPTQQDNYEPVEMDIDSNPGSPAISAEGIPGMEDLQFDQEFINFQQQQQPVPLMSLYFHDPSFQTYGWMDHSREIPFLETTAIMPVPLELPPPPPPPPPPPLPSDWPPPPPPPEEPPPLPSDETPPLPPEPPPWYAVPPPPPEEDKEEEDDEEALLRAKLLHSMATRKMQLVKESQSEASSPITPRSQSPSVTEISKPKESRPITMIRFPKQPQIIINLDEDTSSEEDEDEQEVQNQSTPVTPHISQNPVNALIGGLDSFLKEARRNSELQELKSRENVKKLSDTRQVIVETPEFDYMSAEKTKIKQFEEDIVKQRAEILKDQGQFKTLLSKTAKFQKNMKQSQEKVEVLREQLTKAENLFLFFKEHFEKNRQQARQFKEQIQKKMKIFQEKEKLLMLMGQKVYGTTYKPRSVVAKSSGTNKVSDLSVTVINENATKTKGKENINKTISSKASLAKEKERLQRLADNYSRKIQELKDLQAKRDQLIKENRSPVKIEKQTIPRLEKIAVDSDVPDMIILKPNNRRRSLKDINPSNKPNIDHSHHNSVLNKSLNESHGKSEGEDGCKSSPENIQKLGELQLRKLKTLQMENVEKYLSTLELPDLSSPSCHPLLIPQYQQISSFTEQQTLSKQKSLDSWYPKMKYRSPLLHFKAYRFSPYFRIKEKMSLSSPTFVNKINPKKIMCRFDIQGTCHDDECAGQHQSHYLMSQDEILQDIISYCPSVAEVDNATPTVLYPNIIGRFVAQTRKQYEGMFTIDRLYVLMASEVNEKSSHIKPHTMFFKPRKWRPTQLDSVSKLTDLSEKDLSVEKLEWQKPLNFQELDNVINDQDLRYFVMSDTVNIQDLESSVLDSPQDVDLWLKLAYKKFYDPQIQDGSSLDNALNVLARGLEENKCSCDLWKNYLKLYSRHKESTDLADLCATALEYTQHYDIWWQYMSASPSCIDKQNICDMIMNYLQTQETLSPDEMSHDLLETMLYKTSLFIWSGKLKTAHKFLQGKLKNIKENTWIHASLQTDDKCILWLSYIHLKEFKQLPSQLYDPQNQMSGRIVNKDKIIIPWNSLPKTLSPESVDVLKSLMWKAVQECISSVGKSVVSVEVLYVNIFNLLQSQQRYEEAAAQCRKLLMMDPTMIDIWLCVAELYSTCGDPVATRQVLADASAANRFSAQLCFYAASYEILQGDGDRALEGLEMCAISYFDVDIQDSKRSDPNLLYCTLLDESVPLQYQPPDFKEGVSQGSIEEEIVYVWMNYCLLLEQQGDCAQAIEAYETALCKLENVSDITKIWTSYLQFYARQVVSSKNNTEATKTMSSLVYRAVTSIPTKFECPFTSSDCQWINYMYINTILDLYLNCLPKEILLAEYEKFITIMPSNVPLILRACYEAISRDDLQQARSFCNAAIYDNVHHISLWKMVISVTIKQENIREARRLYQRAVQVLPYSVTLWKDYLMFEVCHGSQEVIPQILARCHELGLSMEDYVNFIMKVK